MIHEFILIWFVTPWQASTDEEREGCDKSSARTTRFTRKISKKN